MNLIQIKLNLNKLIQIEFETNHKEKFYDTLKKSL